MVPENFSLVIIVFLPERLIRVKYCMIQVAESTSQVMFLIVVHYKWSTLQVEYLTSGVPYKWSTLQVEYLTSGVPYKWSTLQVENLTSGVPYKWSTL